MGGIPKDNINIIKFLLNNIKFNKIILINIKINIFN